MMRRRSALTSARWAEGDEEDVNVMRVPRRTKHTSELQPLGVWGVERSGDLWPPAEAYKHTSSCNQQA
eukprot:353843-Chlamydomonas_euryale.AAC.3